MEDIYQINPELDIPIYRFHDYSHFTDVDKIHTGFVNKLGLKGEFDGERVLTLSEPMWISEIEKTLAERLDLKHVRFIGQRSKRVKRIALCAGAWGEKTLYEQLNRQDIDLVICGKTRIRVKIMYLMMTVIYDITLIAAFTVTSKGGKVMAGINENSLSEIA